MDIAGWVAGLVAGIFLLFLLALYARSSMDLQKHLSAESRSSAALVCKDGLMTYGDGSIPDRVFEDGQFRCTDWRTSQGLELEQAQRAYRKAY